MKSVTRRKGKPSIGTNLTRLSLNERNTTSCSSFVEEPIQSDVVSVKCSRQLPDDCNDSSSLTQGLVSQNFKHTTTNDEDYYVYCKSFTENNCSTY